jgi:predicted acylesterase/phospholipase RssA
MAIDKIPERPLEKIALSCSGGGYRAASFHLGAMSYLNHLIFKNKPLLENVKLISTVSGGTITGVVYALKKQQGWSFEQIYHFLLSQLRTLDLVKLGIEKLNPNGKWNNKYKRKNLINAFAELYDEAFTEEATFAVFDNMTSHLEAVVFNSTEFNNGINFRFRNKGTGFFGNYMIRIPDAIASEVKLSDAIASSSCFTGGFEPMIWPQDFVHNNADVLLNFSQSAEPIGVMDGGIYDNQGIESILNYKKNRNEPYFDLVIISDVASPYMDPFVPFADQAKTGFRNLTLSKVKDKAIGINKKIDIGLLMVIVLLLLAPIVTGYANTFITGLFIGIAFSALLIFIAKTLLLTKIKKFSTQGLLSLRKKLPPFYIEKLSNLKIEELSVRRMEPLILDRLNSLLTLVGDVFLKAIRRLNYYKLYDNEQYRYRRITNLIKELTEIDFNERRERKIINKGNDGSLQQKSIVHGDYSEVIGKPIKELVEKASSFGTTLWFTEDEQLDKMLEKLIAAGQVTICYNMLTYLETLLFETNNGFENLGQDVKDELVKLYEECKKDWLRFKEDPYFMSTNFSSQI